MKAIILAGGRGTRLNEETEFKPKPMVMIGDKPIIWHIMKLFSFYGVNDFIICLGYKGQLIIDFFSQNGEVAQLINDSGDERSITKIKYQDGDRFWNIDLVDTGLDTLTARRLFTVKPYLDDDISIVTYGDGVADINIKKLLHFHVKHKKPATVSITQPVGRFGVVHTNLMKTVTKFSEKPKYNEWINCGFFVFSPEVFEYFEKDEYLEVGPMLRLVQEKKLKAFRHFGYWGVMDTYREFLDLNEIWDSGNVPWKVWGHEN